MRVTESHITDFLVRLGRLTASTMGPDEAMDRITDYAPMLSREFDSGVFCPDALAYVASRSTFFPAYGELCGHLRAWWRDNRPFLPALPAPVIPDRVPPTQAEMDAGARLARQAVGVLQGAEPTDAQRFQVKASYLSDGHLLAVWEQMAKDGNGCALARVGHLRAKIERQAGERG